MQAYSMLVLRDARTCVTCLINNWSIYLCTFIDKYFIYYFLFLLAIAGGHKRKSLDEVSGLYKDLSTKIFTQSAIKGTSNLVWSHAYYDTALWEQLLAEHLGDKILIKTTRDPYAPKVT